MQVSLRLLQLQSSRTRSEILVSYNHITVLMYYSYWSVRLPSIFTINTNSIVFRSDSHSPGREQYCLLPAVLPGCNNLWAINVLIVQSSSVPLMDVCTKPGRFESKHSISLGISKTSFLFHWTPRPVDPCLL